MGQVAIARTAGGRDRRRRHGDASESDVKGGGAMSWIESIGLMAGALTTIAFLPQARKVWTTRLTKDISLAMYIVFTCGVALWLTYGYLIMSLPLILANSITLVFAIYILLMKLRYG